MDPDVASSDRFSFSSISDIEISEVDIVLTDSILSLLHRLLVEVSSGSGNRTRAINDKSSISETTRSEKSRSVEDMNSNQNFTQDSTLDSPRSRSDTGDSFRSIASVNSVLRSPRGVGFEYPLSEGEGFLEATAVDHHDRKHLMTYQGLRRRVKSDQANEGSSTSHGVSSTSHGVSSTSHGVSRSYRGRFVNFLFVCLYVCVCLYECQ